MSPPRVLIIAGSDSGGGAGIQADIKTVTMLGGFAMTVVTAITAQSTIGISDVDLVPTAMIEGQLHSVFQDLRPHVIKIGMIGSAAAANAIADHLAYLEPPIPIVFDPVMVATSGAALASDETVAAFDRLMRLAAIITPNLPELAALTDQPVETEAERILAAGALARENGCAVLAKGGHGEGGIIVDLLVGEEGAIERWAEQRIDTPHTHGTGCTLASAIATGLGEGRTMLEAVGRARAYVRAALAAAPGFGGGQGPIGHALGVIPFDHIHRKDQ
jgi:hydroxymethylpyrimidine/phosphomethylpyrimidine kinase